MITYEIESCKVSNKINGSTTRSFQAYFETLDPEDLLHKTIAENNPVEALATAANR